MTDKELRKLSRLELLELLLEVSKEKDKLNEKIEKLKTENEMAKSVESLSRTARQVNMSLEHANKLANALTTASQRAAAERRAFEERKAYEEKKASVTKEKKAPVSNNGISDKSLYWRIMSFYAKNNGAMESLPEDIRNDVQTRINGIIESRKNK